MLAVILALPLGAVPLAASYWWEYDYVVGKIADKESVTKAEVRDQLTFGQFLDLKKKVGWKVKSSTVNGAMVWLVWLVEAGLVMGFAVGITVGAVREPYCEKCNAWCVKEGYAVWGVTGDEAQPLIERGDVAALVGIAAGGTAGDTRGNLTMEIAHCPSCKESAYLTIVHKWSVMKGKQPQEKKRTLLTHATLLGEARETALGRLSDVTGQKLTKTG
jgi:hypothetical protein